MSKTISRFILSTGLVATSMFSATTVYAQCAAPVSIEGGINYDAAADTLNVCDGTTWLVVGPGGLSNNIQDTDGDTIIQVEEGADDDTIRMDANGAEIFAATDSTIFLRAGGAIIFDANNSRTILGSATGPIRIGYNNGHPELSSNVTNELRITDTLGLDDQTLLIYDAARDRSASFVFNDDAELNISTTAGDIAFMPAGSVGIGIAAPNASAKLQVDSTTQGFLPPRNADPATNITGTAGLIAYDSTDDELQFYNGSAWVAIASGASAVWTDNTTHVTRENFHILDTGLAAGSTTAGIDGDGTYAFFDPDKGAFRGGAVSGGNNAWEDANIGDNSFAFGLNTEASGNQSTAIGSGTTASGNQSIAIGTSTTASGTASAVTGGFSTASGEQSTAMGLFTTASGDQSTAMGATTTASGTNSTAMGNGSTASGYSSTVMGSGNIASGYISATFGNEVRAGDGTAQANDASSDVGNYSMAFGLGNSSTATRPQVTGNESAVFFFGDQNGEDITATNVLALEGGSLLLSNDSGTACVAAKAGAVRLNASADGIEMCDGTSTWDSLVSVGSSVSAIDDLSDAASDATSVFLGASAGANDDGTANNNTGLGISSLNANTSGDNNTAVGYRSLITNSTGYRNTALGMDTLYDNTIGYQNTAIGEFVLALNTEGEQNTAIGQSAMSSNLTGGENTAVGYQAGSSITTGDFNILIGSNANPSGAGVSNELNIGGTIFADLGLNKVGIGVTDVTAINGDAALEVYSTTEGFLPPRLADPDGTIGATTGGLIAYDSTDNELQFYNGSAWVAVATGASAVWTDNTTHVTRENFHILDAGLAAGSTTAGLDGDGTYAFFDPDKGAFRGGTIAGGDAAWQDINIGTDSFAYGNNAIASGDYGFAIGDDAEASGDNSMALGENTIASANHSAAIGYGAEATAFASFATGNSTTASQSYSTAMGFQTTASGTYSTAIGFNSVASNNASFATGGDTLASGLFSTAMGREADAVGDYSFAMGRRVRSTGNFTYAVSLSDQAFLEVDRPVVSGEGSFGILMDQTDNYDLSATDTFGIIGGELMLDDDGSTAATQGCIRFDDTAGALQYSDDCSAYTSFSSLGGLWTDNTTHISYQGSHLIKTGQTLPAALGNNGARTFWYPDKFAFRGGGITGSSAAWQDASIGNYSFAFGQNTSAGGDHSIAMGHNNTVPGDYSIAMGFNNTATGIGSTAIGFSSDATNAHALAMGDSNTASAVYSLALGKTTTASGYNSTAFGREVIAGDGIGQINDGTALKGNYSVAFGLGNSSTATLPRLTGNESAAFFFGDQNGEDITATNVLALEGGSLLLSNDSGSACDATKAGALRLNAGATGLEMCDGASSWDALGGGSAINDLSDAYTDYATLNNFIMGRTGAVALTAGAQYNTFIGENAGATTANSTSATDFNTAIGWSALKALTSGNANTAIGVEAMDDNETGDQNVAVGLGAMHSNVARSRNTAIGYEAMRWATNSSSQVDSNNTAVGFHALRGSGSAPANTGINNTAIGTSALYAQTSGSNNVALGVIAGDSLTTGSNNILIGFNADVSSSSASNELNIGNVIYADIANNEVFLDAPAAAAADGDLANGQVTFWVDAANNEIELKAKDSAGDVINVTVGGGGGASALNDLSDAETYTTNTFIAQGSGPVVDTTGVDNLAVGRYSAESLTTGQENAFFGGVSGRDTTIGLNNAFFGFQSGLKNVGGSYNSFMGHYAGAENLSGDSNVIIGNNAGSTLTTGDSNILIGRDIDVAASGTSNALNIGDILFGSGVGTTAGSKIGAVEFCDENLANCFTAVSASSGVSALDDLSDATTDYVTDNNLAIGQNAGASIASGGSNNTLIGISAGTSLTTGDENVALGRNAMGSATLQGYSVAIGHNAAASWTGINEFNSIIAIGGDSAISQVNGFENIAIGGSALSAGGGDRNTVLGYGAAFGGLDNENTIIGQSAMASVTGGNYNVVMGQNAANGQASANINQNVVIGKDAANAINTGADNNTIIGYNAANTLTTGASNIVIGASVNPSSATASNELNIGGTIFGNTSTDQVGIGGTSAATINANAALEVTSTTRGFLPPRNTNPTGNITGTAGLIAYDSTDNELQFYNGTSWVAVATGGAGGSDLDSLTDGATDYATDFNLFIGDAAGAAIASGGQYNLAIGQNAGDAISTGDNNIAIGYDALTAATTITDNIAIGYNAARLNNSMNGLIAIGANAAQNHNPAVGSGNIAIGDGALETSTDGYSLMAIGSAALQNAASGGIRETIAIGAGSFENLGQNAFSEDNLGVGGGTGIYMRAGNRNTFLGQGTARGNQSNFSYDGDDNVFIGNNSGLDLDNTNSQNTIIGSGTAASLAGGSSNILLGYGVDVSSGTSSNELNIGNLIYGDLANNEVFLDAPATAAADGDLANGQVTFWVDAANDEIELKAKDSAGDVINVTVGGGGGSAIDDLSDGIHSESSLYLGNGAGANDDLSANRNTAIGFNALNAGITVTDNVAIGYQVLDSLTSGGGNLGIGYNVLTGLTTGSGNVGLGSQAMLNTVSANYNLAMGSQAMRDNTGNSNIAMGQNVLFANEGDYNIAIGANALNDNTTGQQNIALGRNTLDLNIGGDNNIAIGDRTGNTLTSGDDNILIGNNIEPTTATSSNELNIGNTIYGDLANGYVGIGTATPASGLHLYNSTSDAALSVEGNENSISGLALHTAGNGSTILGGGAAASGWLWEAKGSTWATSDEREDLFLSYWDGSSWDEWMFIAHDTGYIGLGGNIDPDVTLDITGDIEYTGTITDVSDARLKDNIEPLNKHGSLLDRINQIEAVSFTMKDDEDHRTEYGVIAQQLEKIFPDLVHTADDEMGTKSVNYVGLIAPMIEATKELKSENDALKAEINDIKQDIAGMKMHTGYNIEKANIQNLAMMLIMMLFGGACVIMMNRLGRKS